MDNPNVQAKDYPPVQITNSTPYNAWGRVHFRSAFCRDDDYHVTTGTTWTGPGRGVCLVTRITATVKTPKGDIVATPYESSGTSFSRFAIIQTGPDSFQVTRIVNALEDQTPEGYVEPATQQN
ncbi:MAG: hypothetical protein ACJ76J_05865 [Thermoanaerobaculia bacterium]